MFLVVFATGRSDAAANRSAFGGNPAGGDSRAAGGVGTGYAHVVVYLLIHVQRSA